MHAIVEPADNVLPFENVFNFRSLEGIKTHDNAYVKENVLFRGATLDFATPSDMRALQALKVDRLIDFRSEREKVDSPLKALNQQFNRTEHPIDVGDFFSKQRLEAIRNLDLKSANEAYYLLYTYFVRDYGEIYRAFFSYLNQGERFIFHCSAGKDRTGMAAYLILSALGVEEEVIIANYLASNLYVEELYQTYAESIEEQGIDPDFYRQLQYVKTDYLFTAKKKILEQFPSVEAYLRKELNADFDAIRNHYLIG